MKVLNQASKAAHRAILAKKDSVQPYSRFPVGDTEFWSKVFEFAKNPKHAQKVIDEMEIIEAEPCIENEKVWLNVQAVRRTAKLALLN